MRSLAAFALVLAACGWDEGPIRPDGEPVTTGALTVAPITFVETEYWLIPTPRKLIPGPRTVAAEEGWLRVPVRHAAPGGDSLTIHFARLPSTSDNPGPPIVYLAGGPGGSGTLSAAGDRWPVFQALREVGDVIALDQRGVYLTAPHLVCPGSWDQPLDRPVTVATRSEAIGQHLRDCHRHWSDSLDLDAFNTLESAADLDALRRALGAEQLSLWGISYGTHLALAYARQYPDRVAHLILAGTEGPDHTWKLPSNLDRVMLRIDSAMRADAGIAARVPRFLEKLERVLARLDSAPATVRYRDEKSGDSITLVIGADDLRRGIFTDLGEREDIERFPQRIVPILEGDFTRIAPNVVYARRGNRELAMSVAMDCASGATAARLATIDSQAVTSLFRDAGNLGLRTECPHFPVTDLGDDYRAPLVSPVPALFISGTLDMRTPPSNAEEVRAGFANSHHLILDGAAHDDDLIIGTSAIRETMLAFLRGERDLSRTVVLPPIRFTKP